jgi:large conductance mechanosensitive channel
MKKFFGEFKEFISKGNVMDLAIGMVIGGMFTKIVNSVVNDILMPIVSLLTGRTNFQEMFILLSGEGSTLKEATDNGATILSYGNLIELIINFILTALFLFLVVKALNKARTLKKKDEETEKEEKSE